jgi:hypothetical protein
VLFVLTIACAFVAMGMIANHGQSTGDRPAAAEHALKVITLNTGAYKVEPAKVDKRSIPLAADEDMHIVALEHFTGVGKGQFSDNGHMLSTSSENPWVKWEAAGTGMEPTGTKGYFGYCGRDYYSEVNGINDVMAYESLPAGTHVLVRRGETLHMHCYAANFSPGQPALFHHAVRVLYW